MLKFLTHKLRTHSLNEDPVVEKVEERDSGTESDDEQADTGEENTDVVMKWSDVTDTDISIEGIEESEPAVVCDCPAPVPPPPPLPHADRDLMYDHHSSEEELEVINGEPGPEPARASRRRGASSPPAAAQAPGKRKWPYTHHDHDKVETPVRFRTSPPLEALKPRRAVAGCAGAPAAAAATAGCAPSPRRRRAPPPPLARRHRPQLDFDKMQQLKVPGGGGVRSWRGVGGAGGELSVFCW